MTNEPSAGELFGRYRLERQLGSGGMGSVWLAHPTDSADTPVVIKVLHSHLSDDPRSLGRFLEETRLARLLHHPNIVEFFEVGRQGDGHFLVMEFVDGLQLRQCLTAHGAPLSPTLAAAVFADACAGLEYAHTLTDGDGTPLRLVHRDIAPDNLMVDRQGQVKLVDFGIARTANTDLTTKAGDRRGKVRYAPPEYIKGQDATPRSDVYSMGATLFEICTGKRPFDQLKNIMEIATAIVQKGLPAASSLNPAVPPELSAIIAAATQRDPARRFPSAGAMEQALRRFLANHPAPTPQQIGGEVAGWLERRGAGALQTGAPRPAPGVRPSVQGRPSDAVPPTAAAPAGMPARSTSPAAAALRQPPPPASPAAPVTSAAAAPLETRAGAGCANASAAGLPWSEPQPATPPETAVRSSSREAVRLLGDVTQVTDISALDLGALASAARSGMGGPGLWSEDDLEVTARSSPKDASGEAARPPVAPSPSRRTEGRPSREPAAGFEAPPRQPAERFDTAPDLGDEGAHGGPAAEQRTVVSNAETARQPAVAQACAPTPAWRDQAPPPPQQVPTDRMATVLVGGRLGDDEPTPRAGGPVHRSGPPGRPAQLHPTPVRVPAQRGRAEIAAAPEFGPGPADSDSGQSRSRPGVRPSEPAPLASTPTEEPRPQPAAPARRPLPGPPKPQAKGIPEHLSTIIVSDELGSDVVVIPPQAKPKRRG